MKNCKLMAGVKMLLAIALLQAFQTSAAGEIETFQQLNVVDERAGDYISPLTLYMQKYSSTWNRKERSGDNYIIGKAMPEFYFTKQLNSKALRGKTVVLTFWATWCGGCRLLCADLDSVMVRQTDEYKDIQIIGVDADEKLTSKGYVAQKWWQQKGIGFPTTAPGKAADACGKSIEAGHPTTVIIDAEGIVRGRWDAWTPDVAGNVALAAWIIDIAPKQGIKPTTENVDQCLAARHYDRALYLLEQMPTDTLTMPQRWQALLNVSDRKAMEYYDSLKQQNEAMRHSQDWKWQPSAEYLASMRSFRDAVLSLSSPDVNILRRASESARLVANWSRTERVRNSILSSEMTIRYGKALQQQACQSLYYLKKQSNDASPEEQTLIRQAIDRYGISEEKYGDHDPVHRQMEQDKKEQEMHMASMKKK